MDKNVVGWFEIPVSDMERAMAFYKAVFGYEMSRHQMGPLDMAWFPWSEEGVGSPGSLVRHPDFYKPTLDGVVIYFTSPQGDVEQELAKVEDAGGKVLQGKTKIGEDYGYMGLILDTEGNRIAVHSRA